MPKILLLTLDFPPRTGGVARYLEALAKFFHKEILVFAVPEQGSEDFDASAEYPIERHDLLWKKIWPRWLKTVWLLIQKKDKYKTVIVSHVLPLGTAAWLAKFFTGKPYIVIVHGMDVALAGELRRKKWLVGKILRGARVVVTNSIVLAEEVKRDFGVKSTEVVYPGIKNSNHLRLDRALNGQGLNLLTVSRLVPRKGHPRVLQALAKIKDQIPNLQYRIVGDGPMKEALQKTVADLGLSSIVKFAGLLSDAELAEVYEQADLFVMPTVADSVDREGFGIVYLEAAVHGVPSIATDQPGVDEAVLNNQTGLLIPDGDIEALSEAILHLWGDPEERRRLGSNAQKWVLEEFTWKKQLEKLRRCL
ncbi:MAG: glycosyltransferase family 4 protein [Candidatus Uhrbacteria bacterium]